MPASRPPGLHSLALALLACVALAGPYNWALWRLVLAVWPGRGPHDLAFIASIGVTLTCLFFLVLQVFAWRRLLKPVLAFVLAAAGVAAWFMVRYGVMIDRAMIANMFETDPAEAADILTWQTMAALILLGGAPAIAVLAAPLRRVPPRRELALRALALCGTLAVIGLVAGCFYQDYASLIRNNRQIRNLVNPSAPLWYTASYLRRHDAGPVSLRQISASVGRAPVASDRPLLLVMVVGEAARADRFGLNGNPRPTSPELAALDPVMFHDAWSCGTSTAESLPCMFAPEGRADYQREQARHSENALDLARRAGLDVVWIENQSGCKDVCSRVETITPNAGSGPDLCDGDECHDEALLRRLADRVAHIDRDTLVVLHQMGSHGPAYFKRYPPAFARFTPVCDTPQLQECDRDAITNAYDNSIAYTDHVLAGAIGLLRGKADVADTALIYAADHGESLGEMGVYLHGLPYAFAPEAQRHIAMMLWTSPSYRDRMGLDAACLAGLADRPVSHDNLFHSLLGGAGVTAAPYQPGLDVFALCGPDGRHAGLDVRTASR